MHADVNAPGPALNLIVVEDSELDAELMVRELKRFGYAVVWQRVDTPAGLTAALDREPWEIVLADYSLPRFSGLEALELVRIRDQELPFILISGTIGEDTAVAAIRAGANDYLLKDRLARLGPAVKHALREAGEEPIPPGFQIRPLAPAGVFCFLVLELPGLLPGREMMGGNPAVLAGEHQEVALPENPVGLEVFLQEQADVAGQEGSAPFPDERAERFRFGDGEYHFPAADRPGL